MTGFNFIVAPTSGAATADGDVLANFQSELDERQSAKGAVERACLKLKQVANLEQDARDTRRELRYSLKPLKYANNKVGTAKQKRADIIQTKRDASQPAAASAHVTVIASQPQNGEGGGSASTVVSVAVSLFPSTAASSAAVAHTKPTYTAPKPIAIPKPRTIAKATTAAGPPPPPAQKSLLTCEMSLAALMRHEKARLKRMIDQVGEEALDKIITELRDEGVGSLAEKSAKIKMIMGLAMTDLASALPKND